MFFSNVRNDMTELRIFNHNEFGSVAVVLDRAFYPSLLSRPCALYPQPHDSECRGRESVLGILRRKV